MKWNDFDDLAINDPVLKVKEKVKENVRMFVMQLGCDDPAKGNRSSCEYDYKIEHYCDAMSLYFDGKGNIISITLPDWAQTVIYDKEDRKYLRMDIKKAINALWENEVLEDCNVSEREIGDIMETYYRRLDCNVPYNTTIEEVIKEVLHEKVRKLYS